MMDGWEFRIEVSVSFVRSFVRSFVHLSTTIIMLV
jgi:hypothetical protein